MWNIVLREFKKEIKIRPYLDCQPQKVDRKKNVFFHLRTITNIVSIFYNQERNITEVKAKT